MAQIRITPGMMKDQATQLGNLKADHEANFNAIRNHINNTVLPMWEGEAKAAFEATWIGHQSQFEKFGAWMEELRVRLNTTAQKMQDAEDAVKSNVSQALQS